ncbi:MAG TPA: amino acid adenylation domain-containing protein, partial [Gemmatimonadales bacterium]|nr:amino acid adenylation domain-containing protein [Gemmatimonadales bacterium]
HHWRAKYTYQPRWYDGRIDLVQATTSSLMPRDLTLGWGRLAREVAAQFPHTSHIRIVMTHLPAILREAIGRVAGLEREPPKAAVRVQESSQAALSPPAAPVAEEPTPPEAPDPTPDAGEYVFPASFAQRRLWFLHQLAPDSEVYNIPISWVLRGKLDASAFVQAWKDLLARHEALRTTFRLEEGEPVQVVSTAVHPASRLAFATLGTTGAEPGPARVDAMAALEFSAPFDIAHGPLVRGRLFRVANDEHVLLGTIHHIVSDAWSLDIFYRELATLYAARLRGEGDPLPELTIQYPDFTVWQRDWLSGDTLERKLAYWREQLRAPLPPLELPTDRPRGPAQTFNGGQVDFTIPAAVHGRLLSLCHQEGSTLFTGLLAAYAALLHRHTGQDDVVVGTPSTGRPTVEVEQVIGFFVNTLPLRVSVHPEQSFRALLATSRRVLLDGLANPDVPFEKLVEVLHGDGDRSRNPIFQTMLSTQEKLGNRLQLPGIRAERLNLTQRKAAKFDLHLAIAEGAAGESLEATLEFNSDLFDEVTARTLANRFMLLLSSAVSNPELPVGEIPLMEAAERHRLLVEGNATAVPYPADLTLTELLERQAARTPDAVAVWSETGALTYAELHGRANRLAQYLRRLGVGPGVLVAICAERSLEMVIGLLAILKSGGAYVPIDPEYPAERVRFMLEDCAAPVLLTQEHLVAALPPYQGRTFRLDRDWSTLAGEPDTAPAPSSGADDLAYMIYTSGSTGRPKGALNAHRGIVNRLLWGLDHFQFQPADRVMQKTPFSFDVSVWEFFSPLISGARLVLARPGGHRDAGYLADLIDREGITVIHFVPSMLRMFLDGAGTSSFETIRDVVCSGEALPFGLMRRSLDRLPGRLTNLYGPTETAVEVTCWTCDAEYGGMTVPIGKPIANTQTYIVNPRGEPVATGIAGELLLGGVQVGLGYHNRPDLTAEKFIPDHLGGRPNARLYRTGDLARYLRDGNIEYLGRLDQQVKLRGFRIELGEIEAALRTHPAVADAAVRLVPFGTDQALVAWTVPRSSTAPDPAGLGTHLRTVLPAYMVPSSYVTLAALPVNGSGKVDTRALPIPSRIQGDDAGNSDEPRSTLEVMIREIWQRLLPGRAIGIHDDFFHLGGHSLLAARMVDEIERGTGIRLPIARLFTGATIAKIAETLLSRHSGGSLDVVAVRPGTNGIPFFMVHGDFSGGGFYCRGVAAALGPDQGVYAIPPYAPNGFDDTTTIEGMAALHLKAIRDIQPHGPYRLGGYCIAGLVAFEMARQLRAAGESVDLLILVDASAANIRVRTIAPLLRAVAGVLEPWNRVRRGRRFGVLVERVRSLMPLSPWRRALVIAGYPVRVAARTIGGRQAPAEPSSTEALDRQVRHHWNAKFQYFPRWYDGRVDLLWSKEESSLDSDASRGWSELAREVVSVQAESNHLRLVFDDLPSVVRDALIRLRSHG